jgi:hypothetical protein
MARTLGAPETVAVVGEPPLHDRRQVHDVREALEPHELRDAD